MPIKDDEKRRAYFREYMRKRRAGTSDAAASLGKLRASVAEGKPPDDELARRIKEALAETNNAREKMDAATAEILTLVKMLLPRIDRLLEENETLVEDYDELVDDYNELLDELPDENEEAP